MLDPAHCLAAAEAVGPHEILQLPLAHLQHQDDALPDRNRDAPLPVLGVENVLDGAAHHASIVLSASRCKLPASDDPSPPCIVDRNLC